jgi:microsomal dipeptidase-like Zn-dependent dipeptidase
MRNGRWTRTLDFGEGSAANAGFPPQPPWFRDNRDFPNIAAGLRQAGLADADVSAIMGGNWLRFFDENLSPSS